MIGSAAGGRPPRAASRTQIKRRRVAALLVVSFVTLIAILVASAVPTHQPVLAPQSSGIQPLVAAAPAAQPIVVARLGGSDVMLPVAGSAATAIAFHAVDATNSVALTPAGAPAGNGQSVVGDGVPHYYMMAGAAGDVSGATSGLDVGAPPGTPVVSPVDGQVAAIQTYQLLGKYNDAEIDIRLASDPTLLLVMTHVVVSSRLHVGDMVAGGVTLVGRVRGFPASLHQEIKQYTNDAGDHVQLVTLRTAPDLAGF
jgi:hypothetical protein